MDNTCRTVSSQTPYIPGSLDDIVVQIYKDCKELWEWPTYTQILEYLRQYRMQH